MKLVLEICQFIVLLILIKQFNEFWKILTIFKDFTTKNQIL